MTNNIVNRIDGFQYTTAIKKLRIMRKRVRGVPGGTSAGKTYGILPILIDEAIKTPNLEISVVSETVPHLRKGALKDFLKIMRVTGRYVDDHYNRTLLTYTFDNNSYIEFFSAEQSDKVMGPRRNVLYINECNHVSFEVFHHLRIRTNKVIWLDFNPANQFWYHTELQDDEDFEELVLTYKDNEALDIEIVRDIEKARVKAFHDYTLPVKKLLNKFNIKNEYWANWWKVYGLGMLGSLEGIVFTNWKQIDGVPANARLIGYGLDFGYTNHPSALIALYEYEGKRLYDELLYRTGMVNQDLALFLKEKGIMRGDTVIADSAEPKSIEEINRYGFRLQGADKGPDSIVFGIDVMQQDDFLVTSSSVNTIKELRSYMWGRDKDGNYLNKPVDAFNHSVDAMRYITSGRVCKRKQKRKLKVRN
jgi:phage terminase large subunit